MTKAEQMLAKAGFPNTKAGRAAFHKMYPSPQDYFKVYGDMGLTPTEFFKKYGYLDKDNDAKQEPDSDVDDMMYGDGGSIHIKPSKRGTFTAAATKHGKSVQGFASQVLANKENYSPAMVKKANFARNAAKWKHEDGGIVEQYGDGGGNTQDPRYVEYERFPKKDPGFGSNAPNTFWNYMSSLNRGRNYTNPHQGVKDAVINMHTITGSCESGTCYEFADGGVVDAYQLMGMPTPSMYGGGSTVHPTLTLSTEQNPNKASYLNSPYYQDVQSINSRNTLAGTFPISNDFNLTGSYSNANNGTYTAGAEYSLGDVLAGAGGKGPSRRYDNPDIAHRGSNSFLDTYGHLRAGVTNAGNQVVPYWGGDFTVAHQMGRVKGPNGLRQPKGTIYGNLELNQVEDPANNLFVNNDYGRANIGGSYNFGKGLGVYGEAGYDINRNSPRAEIGLKKTFADGGHITHYIPSYNFGHVQSAKNTYRHGYANGGDVYTQANNYNNWLIDPNRVNPNNPMPKYASGGFLNRLGNTWKDSMLLGVDNLTSIINPDIIGDKRYSGNTLFGDSPDTFTDLSHYTGEAINSIVPTALNFVVPGAGTALSAGQMLADRFIKDDPDRLNSKSGQNAAKMGMGLDIAGAVAGGLGAAGKLGTAGAKTASAAAKTAPKTLDTINKVSKGLKYTSLAADAYDTATNPNANWQDYATLGISTAGTVGGDLSSAGKSGLSKSIASLQPSVGTSYGPNSMQALKDMNKYSNIGAIGSEIGRTAKSGRAAMNLYNTGKNIDEYGVNAQTGLQGMNAIGSGLGAASQYSDNPNFQKASDIYNTASDAINYGANVYNTIDQKPTDILPYLQLAPGGVQTAMDLNNMFSNQRPYAFTSSSLGKHAMGGELTSADKEKQQADNPSMLENIGNGMQYVNGEFLKPTNVGANIIKQLMPDNKKAEKLATVLQLAGNMGSFGTYGSTPQGISGTGNFGNLSNAGGFGASNNFGKLGMLGNLTAGMGVTPSEAFNLYELSKQAMGGAVNAPEMMKYASGGTTGYNTYDLAQLSKDNNLMDNSRLLGYNLVGTDKFDDGGMTQNPTQINVEKGELLVNKDGKILTEYRGGGMVPHPADGSMDERGTVPAQEGQFVITKKLAPNYKDAMKNNDSLYAAAMRNNIAFDKQRKEAKQQEQQAMAQQMMAAKFGGMVRGYGYGGYVPKMGAGGPPDEENGIPYIQSNPYTTAINPLSIGSNYGIQPTTMANVVPMAIRPDKNAFITSQVYGTNPNTSYGPWNAANAPTSSTPPAAPAQDLQDSQGPFMNEGLYGNRNYYQFDDNPNNVNTPYTVTPTTNNKYLNLSAEELAKLRQARKDKLTNAAILAGMGLPAAYNILSSAFGKRTHINPQTVAPLQWTNLSGEAQRRALAEAYATSKYNTPIGSGYLAERTKRAADYMTAVAKLEQDIANTNAQGRMAVAEKNAAIAGSNADRNLQAQLYDRQVDAARQSAMATGFSNIGKIADAYRQEQAYKKGVYPNLGPNLAFVNGEWVLVNNKKTGE